MTVNLACEGAFRFLALASHGPIFKFICLSSSSTLFQCGIQYCRWKAEELEGCSPHAITGTRCHAASEDDRYEAAAHTKLRLLAS